MHKLMVVVDEKTGKVYYGTGFKQIQLEEQIYLISLKIV